jgi:chromosome segregation ATPase
MVRASVNGSRTPHGSGSASDIHGESTSCARSDEAREQNLLQADSLRNMENRLTELLASEAARSRDQSTFLAEQARAQVDRERGWKDWSTRYESLVKQAEAFEAQFSSIDETVRSARRAQDTYQELNAKLERRINEITELQRLGEDRLRQEWIAFKSDDQKRWTGYTLSAEESMRDLRKDLQKAESRVGGMDESPRSCKTSFIRPPTLQSNT